MCWEISLCHVNVAADGKIYFLDDEILWKHNRESTKGYSR